MRVNKIFARIEMSVYATLCIVCLGLSFYNKFNLTTSTLLYVSMLILTFGYFLFMEIFFKKIDPAVHYKMEKKYYVPTKNVNATPTKRKGALGVALIWIFCWVVLAIFKVLGFLTLQLFCAGAFFIFFLNSLFSRKLCLLSMFVMHNKNNCCKYCGINGWDFAMFGSALILAPKISVVLTVVNWVLTVASFIYLSVWEYLYHKYPERFSPETNRTLSCKNCTKGCKLIQQKKSN